MTFPFDQAQTRLNAFFVKPARPPPPPVASASAVKSSPHRHNESSDDHGQLDDHKPFISDYQKEFPDFFLQSYTTVAPVHRFQRDADALENVRGKIDSYLASNGLEHLPTFSASDFFHMMPFKRRRGKQVPVKDILAQIQMQDDRENTDHLHDQLKSITMKALQFSEDVRPPYQGTFTRPVSEQVANQLSRNPFRRILPRVNYDYDSEAEWEEPDEGEELDDSEEEEDVSDEGDEDMEGFLDDAEDPLKDCSARRPLVDLEPVCSGLCWEDENGINPKLQAYKMEPLLEAVTLPMDPFSTAYWCTETTPANTAMAPNRSSLHAFAVTSNAQRTTNDIPEVPEVVGTAPGGGKIKRMVPVELMPEFKQAVEESDFTKMGLIDVLKKRYVDVDQLTSIHY